ncbi:MAG: hypothetical protein H6574_01980 [Lewinellaceae bacterium]|nr:hypothetical protein [Saprospiraceae bacterium]MCB9315040.1 hypothetical protein [Lewinellaceae bacterium]MCB9329828.1 hypothetical protein [Lewinellaceae bacterium]
MPQPGLDILYIGTEDWDIPVEVNNAASNRFRDQPFRNLILTIMPGYKAPFQPIRMFLSRESLNTLAGVVVTDPPPLLYPGLVGLVFYLGIDNTVEGNRRLKLIARSANGRAEKPMGMPGNTNRMATADGIIVNAQVSDASALTHINRFVEVSGGDSLGMSSLKGWGLNAHPTFQFSGTELLSLLYSGNIESAQSLTFHLILFVPHWPWEVPGIPPPLCFSQIWLSAAAISTNGHKKGLVGCPPNCYDREFCP